MGFYGNIYKYYENYKTYLIDKDSLGTLFIDVI